MIDQSPDLQKWLAQRSVVAQGCDRGMRDAELSILQQALDAIDDQVVLGSGDDFDPGL